MLPGINGLSGLKRDCAQFDPKLTPPTVGFNVQTENYVNSSDVNDR